MRMLTFTFDWCADWSRDGYCIVEIDDIRATVEAEVEVWTDECGRHIDVGTIELIEATIGTHKRVDGKVIETRFHAPPPLLEFLAAVAKDDDKYFRELIFDELLCNSDIYLSQAAE